MPGCSSRYKNPRTTTASGKVFLIITFLMMAAGMLFPVKSYAQDEEYLEEMVIFFSVPGIGGTDVCAVLGETTCISP
jgi:hypothetical protein